MGFGFGFFRDAAFFRARNARRVALARAAKFSYTQVSTQRLELVAEEAKILHSRAAAEIETREVSADGLLPRLHSLLTQWLLVGHYR